jgi:ribosome biogenesis GTPase
MSLDDLGFDAHFRTETEALAIEGATPARVTAVDRDRWIVRDAEGEMPAELAGRLRFASDDSLSLPCVGDWALVQPVDARRMAVLHAVLPRRTLLKRKAPFRSIDYQPIAANVDTAFLVQSCDGNFNLRRLERYLAMALEAGIEPVVLLAKADLDTPQGVEERIERLRQAKVDAEIIALSSHSGAGLEALSRRLIPRRTHCLLGSSGVGKSTLVNLLLGAEALATAPVRAYDGKGRHTTARRQLFLLDGGSMLIDTPGMRELGAMGVSEGIEATFADLEELAEQCRFKDCAHQAETGCALKAAVAAGEVEASRFEAFLRLRRESEFHETSYLERRRREREFGRRMHGFLKDHHD